MRHIKITSQTGKLVSYRTQIKNTIKAIFVRKGVEIPKGKKLWSKAGIQWLRKQTKSLGKVNIEQLWRGQLYVELNMLEAVDSIISHYSTRIRHFGTDTHKPRCQTVRPKVSLSVFWGDFSQKKATTNRSNICQNLLDRSCQ